MTAVHSGSLMLEASGELDEDDYVKIADYIADFIINRLHIGSPDGALYRINPEHLLMDETLWADDLYMSVPFPNMPGITG